MRGRTLGGRRGSRRARRRRRRAWRGWRGRGRRVSRPGSPGPQPASSHARHTTRRRRTSSSSSRQREPGRVRRRDRESRSASSWLLLLSAPWRDGRCVSGTGETAVGAGGGGRRADGCGAGGGALYTREALSIGVPYWCSANVRRWGGPRLAGRRVLVLSVSPFNFFISSC